MTCPVQPVEIVAQVGTQKVICLAQNNKKKLFIGPFSTTKYKSLKSIIFMNFKLCD